MRCRQCLLKERAKKIPLNVSKILCSRNSRGLNWTAGLGLSYLTCSGDRDEQKWPQMTRVTTNFGLMINTDLPGSSLWNIPPNCFFFSLMKWGDFIIVGARAVPAPSGEWCGRAIHGLLRLLLGRLISDDGCCSQLREGKTPCFCSSFIQQGIHTAVVCVADLRVLYF